jgi:hypothetical protein
MRKQSDKPMSGHKGKVVAEEPVGGMSRAAKKRRLEKNKGESASNTTTATVSKSQESAAKNIEAISKYSIFSPPSTEVFLPECSTSSKNKPYTLRDALDTKDTIDFDASTRAATVLSILLQPISRVDFYADYWQKKHLHICRETPLNTKGIFSSKSLDKMLSKHVLQCPSEVVLGQYVDSNQNYFNDVGGNGEEDETTYTMTSSDIDAAVKMGFAYSLECPQKYLDGVWKVLSTLEFEFGNAMRGNVTVTPVGCQGFGPMMNIGDAFFVQLEGSTNIKASCPANINCNDSEEATFAWPPPVDHHNVVLDAAEMKANVKVAVNVTLQTGNTLYIPKGWVVECSGAACLERGVTLQVTTNHHNGVLDLVEVLYPQAMMAVELKGITGTNSATIACQSLPRPYLEFMGVSRSENDKDIRRKEFKNYMTTVMNTVVERAMTMLDPAADQIAKNFLSSRLPVPTTEEEEAKLCNPEMNSIFPYSKLRMLRPGVARAVVEEGMIVVYHCMDNSRMTHEAPLNPVEFDLDDGPAIEALLDAYPAPVVVMDLHHPSEELEDKVSIAQALFKEGFLLRVEESDEKLGDDEEEDDDDPF